MARRMSLQQRRLTGIGPEEELLEAVQDWLDDHRHTDQLKAEGSRLRHWHRQSREHPWADLGTYGSYKEFAAAHAIGPRRLL